MVILCLGWHRHAKDKGLNPSKADFFDVLLGFCHYWLTPVCSFSLAVLCCLRWLSLPSASIFWGMLFCSFPAQFLRVLCGHVIWVHPSMFAIMGRLRFPCAWDLAAFYPPLPEVGKCFGLF